MSHDYSLSVIVPVHDAELFIGRCIESLLCQGVDNLEIICVENGSTDGSLNVLRQYESLHPDVVRVYSLTESGASVARNYGIEHSHGEVLVFCDADDYVIPNAYGYLLGTYWRENVDLIKFNSVTLDKHMLKVWKETNDVRGEILYEGNSVNFIKQCGYCPTFVWSHLYSRQFIEKHHIWYDAIIIGEDLAFNLIVYMTSANMVAVSSNIYRYTVSKNQVTRIRQIGEMKRISMGYIKVFEMLVECNKRSEIDNAISRQIEGEMLPCFSRVFSADLARSEYDYIWNSFDEMGIWDIKKTLKYTKFIDLMMMCYPFYKMTSFLYRHVFVPYILPQMGRN